MELTTEYGISYLRVKKEQLYRQPRAIKYNKKHIPTGKVFEEYVDHISKYDLLRLCMLWKTEDWDYWLDKQDVLIR